jgi:hypothetical protein
MIHTTGREVVECVEVVLEVDDDVESGAADEVEEGGTGITGKEELEVTELEGGAKGVDMDVCPVCAVFVGAPKASQLLRGIEE